MTALLLLLAMLPTGNVQTGRAVEYRSGLMERVYAVREREGLVRPGWTGGFISRPSCRTIGNIYSVSFRSPVTGRYSAPRAMLQVDCAQNRDRARQIDEGLVAESDYLTALQTGWASEGRTRARVWWTGETWR